MIKLAVFALLEAKQGKEKEVEQFLKSAVEHANAEEETVHWFAFQINETTFGVFDTFEDEEGRHAHLNGKIAAALMANAATLLSKPPVIEMAKLLAYK